MLLLLFGVPAFGQSFVVGYQGRLIDAGKLANGLYDMRFKLFNSAELGAGVQQGTTLTIPSVQVREGIFTVNVDFGSGAVFDGSPRFLEIAVKAGGSLVSYTTLTPRQQVASVPYALHSQSASQLGGVPLTGFVQSDAAGNVGIGSANPAAGVRLEVNGPTRVTPGGSGGYLQIGTPNGETGLGVLGDNRFDLRFDDDTLKLVAGPGIGPPPAQYGITVNTNGNVGIGMPSPLPASQWKLEIDGPTRITTSRGAVEFSSPTGEMGISYQSVSNGRADLRFDGSSLKLVAGPAGGPPSAVNGLVITTAGNVGIGTIDPGAKLHVVTPEAGKAAVYGVVTSTSSVGVFGSASAASSAGVWAHNPTGSAIHADGNATQAREKGGFVKAMLYVRSNGSIERCYNGVTGSSTGDCGFKVNHPGSGIYQITFPFKVTDRFVSITTEYKGGTFDESFSYQRGANYQFEEGFPDNVLTVWTFEDGEPRNNLSSRFMVILF